MNDPFLQFVCVETEEEAMKESLKSALGRNRVYGREEIGNERLTFRREWARLLRQESERYSGPIADAEHCQAIQRIANELSSGVQRDLKKWTPAIWNISESAESLLEISLETREDSRSAALPY